MSLLCECVFLGKMLAILLLVLIKIFILFFVFPQKVDVMEQVTKEIKNGKLKIKSSFKKKRLPNILSCFPIESGCCGTSYTRNKDW